MTEISAHDFINRVAEVATAVGWQAGVGAMELAGQIISCLHANPEHLERFMKEGSGLFIDRTFTFENGSLTYMAISGQVLSPADLRATKGERLQ